MLYDDYTTELLRFEDVIITGIKRGGRYLEIYAMMPRRKHVCPKCGKETEKIHDYRWQAVKDLQAFGKPILLRIRKRRYKCGHCGKRFIEDMPFLPRYHRVTNRLVAHVISAFQD